MKKFINLPRSIIEEMIEGILATCPGLARVAGHNVLVRADAESVRHRQVALISGGGSGHEPAHAGYVGAGMLSAAVAGEVFTSPSPESVFAAIHAVAGKPGVLLIVKNYTGDRLNFGLAAEMARAEGIAVETVIVADDVALAGAHEHAGARGIAGTVFVHKIAGAAAAEGKTLLEVSSIASAAAESIASMGISLSAGTSPITGKPSFVLAEEEIELGLGIHGEPGVLRMKLQAADDLVDFLVEKLLSARSLRVKERLAVLINNLGATTPMELAIVARKAFLSLSARDLIVERIYSGTFLSSLDMAGISLSLMQLDEERLRFLDAPTEAPAWPNVSKTKPEPISGRIMLPEVPAAAAGRHPLPVQSATTKRAIEAACNAVLEAETRLTELDRITGDGDLGTSLARGAHAILEELETYSTADPAETLHAIGLTLQRVLGGSCGPLYGVLFLRVASVLRAQSSPELSLWAQAMHQASEAVSKLGGAKTGDRTMLDALFPFAETFKAQIEAGAAFKDALARAVAAAEAGAEATAQMRPLRGRSSYLGDRVLGHPDPGAIAVTVWLRAIVTHI